MSRHSLSITDWKAEVVPGLYFLTVEPTLAVYGKVLRLQKKGYIWALCYHDLCVEGEESILHHSEITTPLSIWQFKVAKKMGWPSHSDGLTEILTLPPD